MRRSMFSIVVSIATLFGSLPVSLPGPAWRDCPR
jgi:hypothetical protein